MNYKHYIGIDVSKLWLDFTVVKQSQIMFQMQAENSLKGIQTFIKKLKMEKGFEWEHALFCMEHTGIYNNHLLDFFTKKKANVCLESGMQIKQSSGLQRGKNDKVDAERIAMYAYKNRDELKLWKPKREILKQLKHLTTLRARLINVSKQLKTPLKEITGYVEKKIHKHSGQLCKQTIKAVEKDLKNINNQIQQIINADPVLDRLFKIITSITGVGPVTASQIIIATNEFKDITCPKKFACYSGVAPFEHRSGTSIKGKTRVSHLGNKTLKTLLHMSALVASTFNQEIKAYYQRKVQEGKNKMSILNAIRNKLILRIFACVNQNKLYEKNYQYSLV
jgi:transposase